MAHLKDPIRGSLTRRSTGDAVLPRLRKADSKPLPTVEAVVATVRALWDTAEQAPGRENGKLKHEIARTIGRLKENIEARLSRPVNTLGDRPLFDRHHQPRGPASHATAPPISPRFPEPSLRVYAKDLATHALKQLPAAVDCASIEQLHQVLMDRLPFNSQATRRRNASYLVNRYFPSGVLNDLAHFAAAADRAALGEALFYLTCRTEKIVAMVADEVVFPSLALGGVARQRIRDYVQTAFPLSKSATQVATAIIDTYQSFGVGAANRARLNVSLREGSLASFAYVLHLEFPEPGMHAFEKMFDGPMHKWLLWDEQWMVRQLYRLREAGLLSKVSEIDRLRQFTTKFSLAEAVQPIVALAKEPPP